MATEPSGATCRFPHVSSCRARSCPRRWERCCSPGSGLGVLEWPQHPGAGRGNPRDAVSLVSTISRAGGKWKAKGRQQVTGSIGENTGSEVTQRVSRLWPAGSQGTNTKRKVRLLPRPRGQFSRASVASPAHSCPRTLPIRSSNIQNTRSGFSLVTTQTPHSSHLPAELRRWVPATRRNAGGRNRNQSRAVSDSLAFLPLPSPVCKE